MTIPAYLTVYVLTGSVAIVAAIVFGLNRALARADWSADERARVVGGAALILVLWLAGAIALGAAGAFHASSGDVPTLQYGIFLPICWADFSSGGRRSSAASSTPCRSNGWSASRSIARSA